MGAPSKGRHGDILLTTKEATEWLSVPTGVLQQLVMSGVLRPARRGSSGPTHSAWFWSSDIAEVARSLSRNITLSSTAHAAQQALAISKNNRRLLEGLTDALGARYEPLECDEKSVGQFYDQARLLKSEDVVNDISEIVRWAKLLMQIDRQYLETVRYFTNDVDPWRAYVGAADRLLRGAPQRLYSSSPEISTAYGMLAFAKKQLIYESYLYCRRRHGARRAEQVFRSVFDGPVNEAVLALVAMLPGGEAFQP